MAQHVRVLVVGATNYYHHGTIHIRFCCCCLLLAVLCGAWCARGLFRRRLLRCPGHRGGTLLLYMLGLFWSQDHEAREHERKQPRRLSGAHSVAIFCTPCSLAGGDINVRCCCVVYQFIEIRCARFDVYLWLYVVLHFNLNANLRIN